MIAQPILRISRTDLESLMSSLAIGSVKLAECVLGEKWQLWFGAADAPTMYYGLAGVGRIIIGDHPAIDLNPHTLVVFRKGNRVVVEISTQRRITPGRSWTGQIKKFDRGTLDGFDAGEGEQQLRADQRLFQCRIRFMYQPVRKFEFSHCGRIRCCRSS